MQSGIFRRGLAAAAAVALTTAFSATSHINAQQGATTTQRELAAKGAWSDSVTYAKDDIVTSRGSTWRSLRNNNLNKIPGQTHPSTATSWELFARGFNPTGAWSNATKYQPDELVTFNGQTYRAKITNVNKQPTNTTNWELLAAKGAPGPNTGVSGGSQSVPAISFSSDGDTGIYSPGDGKIALVENGARFLHNIGNGNTALGLNAISTASPGAGNTAVGASSLAIVSSTGHDNTAVGQLALSANTDGGNNTAVGRRALSDNVSGSDNTALGYGALQTNTANSNTAVGKDALLFSSTGNYNTAIGLASLSSNTTGGSNTAVGETSLYNMGFGERNTAVGRASLSGFTSGNDNIAIGYAAAFALDTTANNTIFIGNIGVSGDTNLIKIGTSQAKTFIAGIRGKTTGAADAVNVLIDSNGQLGTVNSSRRYKYDIETMVDVSAMLAKLHPVTFRYKEAQDNGAHPLQYGLIAEEVADVIPDLAVFKDGQAETVKYHLLPSFLLAGYQEQQRTIVAQAQEIADLKARVGTTEALEKRLQRLETLLPQIKAAALQ